VSYTDPITWVAGNPLPASDLNSYVRDNFRFLHDRGSDLASAATVTPTVGFHKVTGTTTIDNIAGPANGLEVALWFQSALTVRNNGGGTGNIRTATGFDRAIPAGSLILFRSDGTVWKETGSPLSGAAGSELADSTLLVDTVSFDFQNLPAGGHLEVFVYARTTEAAVTSAIDLRLNNDSGANYDWTRARATSSMGVSETQADTKFRVGENPGSTASGNRFGHNRVSIGHYANAVNHKAISAQYGGAEGTGSGTTYMEAAGGLWRGTGAVTRVTLLPKGGNIATGSRASVYSRSNP
jgi:hypothetical protein